jgi:hypothetical protein
MHPGLAPNILLISFASPLEGICCKLGFELENLPVSAPY